MTLLFPFPGPTERWSHIDGCCGVVVVSTTVLQSRCCLNFQTSQSYIHYYCSDVTFPIAIPPPPPLSTTVVTSLLLFCWPQRALTSTTTVVTSYTMLPPPPPHSPNRPPTNVDDYCSDVTVSIAARTLTSAVIIVTVAVTSLFVCAGPTALHRRPLQQRGRRRAPWALRDDGGAGRGRGQGDGCAGRAGVRRQPPRRLHLRQRRSGAGGGQQLAAEGQEARSLWGGSQGPGLPAQQDPAAQATLRLLVSMEPPTPCRLAPSHLPCRLGP